VLHPLREPPALPAVAPRLGRVGTVELVREDRPRDVDVDAADLVDHLRECVEVDDHDVVDLDVREAAHGLDRERGPAELERRVDLVVPVARDVDAQVARDR
jgi:hypothetical protein